MRLQTSVLALFVLSSSFVACGGGASGTGGTDSGGGGSGNVGNTGGTGNVGNTGGTGNVGNTGGGGADACSVASDCPTPADECLAPACVGGVCDTEAVAAGTIVSSQTAGDCLLVVCDGAGSTTTEDADDPEDDGDACTADTCEQGVNVHTLEPAGTACGVDLVCDATGACVGCLDASECPVPPGECVEAACDAGVCGVAGLPFGTEVVGQSTGDCLVAVCDGSGGVTQIADDVDEPDDMNDCTVDTCSAGVPTYTPAALGTSCGASLVCDASGTCVGCNVPADCGVDGPCVAFTCTSNTCGTSFQPAGYVVGLGALGDCRADACDGAGAVVPASEVDLGDAPAPDGVDCTLELCDPITTDPSSEPAPEGSACNDGGGSVCDDAGACVECVLDSDCGPSTACSVSACTANTCGSTLAPDGTACGFGGQCTAGACAGACATLGIDQDLGSAVGPNVASGTTVGATGNYASAPCQGSAAGPDLAFFWQPPADGCYQLTTDGSSFDTVLHVRQCTDDAVIACDDDSGVGTQSLLNLLDVSASESFVIVVDGYGSSPGASGSFVLGITPITCPLPPVENLTGCPAELCTFAAGAGPNGGDTLTYVIPGASHPDVGDFAGNVCASYGNGLDMLLELDVSSYTSFTVNTCTANADDSSVAAYDAHPSTGTLLGCNGDALGGPAFCSKVGNPAVSGGLPTATPLTGPDLFVVVDEFSNANFWDGITTRTIVVELIP